MKDPSGQTPDVEQDAVDDSDMDNTIVQRLSWQGVKVESRTRKQNGRSIPILSDIDGCAVAGKAAHDFPILPTDPQ